MRILVTGGAGFIGSHLVDALVSRGHSTTVVDNLDPQVHGQATSEPRWLMPHLDTGAVRFLRGDVRDRGVLEDAVENAECVVHLAAAVGVGQSMYAPDYYVGTNSAGTGLLLDVLVPRVKGLRKLVVASSMSLYGEGSYRCASCNGSQCRVRDKAQLEKGVWEVFCAACGHSMDPVPTPESKTPDIASIYAATKKHQEELFVAFGRATSSRRLRCGSSMCTVHARR